MRGTYFCGSQFCGMRSSICLNSSSDREFQLARRGDANFLPCSIKVLCLLNPASAEQAARTRTHAGDNRQQRPYRKPLPSALGAEFRKCRMVPCRSHLITALKLPVVMSRNGGCRFPLAVFSPIAWIAFRLRPLNQCIAAGSGESIDTAFEPGEPAIDIVQQYLRCIRNDCLDFGCAAWTGR
jgi:hypothetical protein